MTAVDKARGNDLSARYVGCGSRHLDLGYIAVLHFSSREDGRLASIDDVRIGTGIWPQLLQIALQNESFGGPNRRNSLRFAPIGLAKI